MAYTIIKSRYVKEKIKKTKWENRDYIDVLLLLEGWIINGARGFAGNLYFHQLKSKYEKEYIAILKELNPERLKEFLAELKLKEKECGIAKARRKKELAKEKKDWIKAGGKP